ncbi:hypothetical protein KI387_015631, partial [Taxus chinensis]
MKNILTGQVLVRKWHCSSNFNPALGKQKMDETYSLGKSLYRSDIADLLKNAIKYGGLSLPQKKKSNGGAELYFVLTSEDAMVENLFWSLCGFHASATLKKKKEVDCGIPYAHTKSQ